MALLNLYIFDRDGKLKYFRDWACKKKASGMSTEEESKLLYGMLFSLKSFAVRISPSDSTSTDMSYRTNKYMMNIYESPTGIKFVCNSDLAAVGVRETLQKIYKQVYVEFFVSNPAERMGGVITSQLFRAKLDQLVAATHAATAVKSA